VTKGCFLQGKNHPDEEWKTLDRIDGNSRNKVERQLPQPAQARYIRLLVTNPVQDAEGKDARIYEFEVYK
jgi:alpha-mannosidase